MYLLTLAALIVIVAAALAAIRTRQTLPEPCPKRCCHTCRKP